MVRGFRFRLVALVALALAACSSAPNAGPEAQAAAERLVQDIRSRHILEAEGPDRAQPDVRIFARVFERVREDYVRPVDEGVLLAAATNALLDADPPSGGLGSDWLVETAIKGMVSSLDPYSAFLPRDEYGAMQDSLRGQFGGLGIQIAKPKSGPGIEVVTPLSGTPAQDAGLQPGDLITHVDRVPLNDTTLSEVVGMLRGPIGSTVSLTVRRGDRPAFEMTLTRDVIRINVVEWRREGDFGYLRISSFSEDTAQQVERAVREIRTHLGGRLAGLIIDLRNNPGGLLIQSVAVSDSFIEEGDIVITRSRTGSQRFSASRGDIVAGLPIAVLVNGGSASAAEILAGALQDHHRAILVGSRTFGKGTVQTVIPMGRGTALKLTTARYFRPSGQSVDGGIEPNVIVSERPDVPGDETLRRAIAELGRLASL